MTQNIYDDEKFFSGYSGLPRSVNGLDGAPEWPSLRAILPPLDATRVLDLGCGFGWFCRYARGAGAASVLGVDLSENMLARARAETSDDAIRYERADLETYAPPPAAFDLVYSSLAFHYLKNLDALIVNIHDALVPGGRLVFSIENPIVTAPAQAQWTTDAAGRKAWPLNDYLREGERVTNWLAEGVIKQHRTFATYAMLLIRAGFVLRHVEEWGPSDAELAARPELADERDRPTFMLMAAGR